jgi:tetratricopeptide (TPR) repeat protein
VHARAIQDYTQAIELDPEDATAYSNRGLAYADSHDYARAIQDYDRAIELDPEDAAAYYNASCAYALMQDPAQACEWLEKAIALDATNRQDARKDTEFDGIRQDARFQALLGEAGSHGAEPPC